jgi:2,3-bisphosphoglycerate-dependent phosphoglycerate mutase
MYKLFLLRHGESIWNKENKFTGWTDVGLTKKGLKEASEAGKLFKKQGYIFDIAFTSFLKKATKTLDLVLKEMQLKHIPVKKSWRLNERFYGALQGLNKAETAKKYGEKMVHSWRRSYNLRPPAITKKDRRYPGKDPLYKNLKKKELPLTESLKDVQKRLLPYWKSEIMPEVKAEKKVLICAHGNSLRALVKYLDNISDKKIENVNIPTGVPLVYELNQKMKPIKKYYLGDPKKLKQKIKIVIKQGKAR